MALPIEGAHYLTMAGDGNIVILQQEEILPMAGVQRGVATDQGQGGE